MRFAFLVGVLCFTLIPAVRAQDEAPPGTAILPADRVQLVEDDENGALRIIINGKEVGWFDATGFYVRGDIAYQGTIADGLPPQEAPDAP